MKFKIKQRREEAGLTQQQLAEMLSIDKNSLARWERFDTEIDDKHSREPSWVTLVKIAEALGITPGMLVSDAAEAKIANEVALDEAPAGLANRNIFAYRVLSTTLAEVPAIRPGEIIYVEQTPEAIAAKKSGDVLLLEFRVDHIGEPVLMLLEFHAPAMVVTNRPGANWALRLDDPNYVITVRGVVLT